MHRYYHQALPNFHSGWLIVPALLWAALIFSAFHDSPTHYEAGVRHSLPDPCGWVGEVDRILRHEQC